jgi:hypothetical protein
MVLRNGKRCPNRAKKGGICGVHRRAINHRKDRIDALIAAGKIAAAATALLKLAAWFISFYPKIAPTIETIWHNFWIYPGKATTALRVADRVAREVQVRTYLALEKTSAFDKEFHDLVVRERQKLFFELHREFGD